MLSDMEIEYIIKKQEYEEEEQEKIPKIVFKYRSLKDSLDFVRFLDIVKNNRLYMPTVNQLNDPFEGGNVDGLSEEANKKLWELRGTHRVLSLSATCFSTLMWANYASEEKGVCIGFYSNKSFFKMKPVEYLDNKVGKSCVAFEDLWAQCSEFKYKTQEWAYEEEYRIDGDYDKYFTFDHDEIACVVVGEKLEDEVRNILEMELVQEGVPILSLRKDYNNKMYYVEHKANLSMRIYNRKELEQYILNHNI